MDLGAGLESKEVLFGGGGVRCPVNVPVWNCCSRLNIQLVHHPGKSHCTKSAFGMCAQAMLLSLPLLSCIQSGAGPQFEDRFLGILKTNKKEGIHASLKTKYSGSLHRDHTTTSQSSNLFVIKKFALWCPHPDNNRSVLLVMIMVCFFLLSPSVLSCCCCNISVCVCLRVCMKDPSVALMTSWEGNPWPTKWLIKEGLYCISLSSLCQSQSLQTTLHNSIIFTKLQKKLACISMHISTLYISVLFNGSAVCEGRSSCRYNLNPLQLSTFTLMPFFIFWLSYLLCVVTSKEREREWRNGVKEKRKKMEKNGVIDGES